MSTKTIIYIILAAAVIGIPVGWMIGKYIAKSFLKAIEKGIDEGLKKVFDKNTEEENIKSIRAYIDREGEREPEEKPRHKVFLFNVTVLTGGPGCYQLSPLTIGEAKELWNNPDYEKVSAIGHQATADVMSVLMGEKIPMNRIEAVQEPGDIAICMKLNVRIQEGTVLTEVEQIEKIGYKLYRLTNDGAMY